MFSRRSFLVSTVAFAAAGTCTAWAGTQSAADRVPLDRNVRASRIAWLDAHTCDLSSIDLEDDDFGDLSAFEEAVGDARIVMLGEQTHGDGTSLLAKGRLTRFLHEEMDFDVLAFESGLYDMRKVWDRMRAGESARKAVRRGLPPNWSRSEEMKSLIEYVGERAQRRRPLELAGFDCRFSASASRDRMVDDLVAFLAERDIDTDSVPDWDRFRRTLEKIADGSINWRPSEQEERLVTSTIESLTERLPGPEEEEAAFWRQLLNSTKALAQLRARSEPQSPSPADLNLLDATMADNLIWLAREAYPERKIIVWGATSRNLRNSQLIDPSREVTTMGHLAWQALGESIYSVGFLAYAGRRLVVDEPREIDPPPSDSLEGLWGATEDENAFLDLRHMPEGGEWLQAPVPSRLVSGDDPVKADWTKVLDGVVFLRSMEPTTFDD